MKLIQEEWKIIPEFPDYEISNVGRVYNRRHDFIMSTSINNFGHVKITLKEEGTTRRFTRSVPLMVAEAFVEPPNYLCDCLIMLDGDFSNPVAENLAWRPRWFAWKYTHQLKVDQPRQYENLPTFNLTLGIRYLSIVHAGMSEGLLFEDIWDSTKSKSPVFPLGHVFEIDRNL